MDSVLTFLCCCYIGGLRESKKALDSGFHAVDSGFLELCSGFQHPRFRIPQVKIPALWIPEAKISRIPKSGIPYTGQISCLRESLPKTGRLRFGSENQISFKLCPWIYLASKVTETALIYGNNSKWFFFREENHFSARRPNFCSDHGDKE